MSVLVAVEVEGVGLPDGFVEATVGGWLVALGLDNAEVSVLLTDDEAIRVINRDWRGKDVATDVLSFPQDDEAVLGDIVVSLDTAARQAAEVGHGLREEVRVLLAHGLCHLLGHDHEDPADAVAMAAAEERLLGEDASRGLVARAGDSG